MRISFLLFTLLTGSWSWGQYQFKGQVSEDFKKGTVYLSLVEDYRKTTRVYLDQIFQKTTSDSLGYFSFTGDNLPKLNRIYRIHVDACDSVEGNKKHFLSTCTDMESILFIANNADTLSLPVGKNQQAFCEINSTNDVSDALLQLDLLKEELIVDVLEQPSEVAKNLTFQKWIQNFQNTSQAFNEPLAELYAYNFLSNRENETYSHYLKNLEGSTYYEGLETRMLKTYQKASFTRQFQKELQADRTLILDEGDIDKGLNLMHGLYALMGIVVLSILFYTYKRGKHLKSKNPFETLSPQERKVLNAILEGKSNKEIATDFYISLSTVKSHINSLYKKLGMSSRTEILSYYKGKQ